MKVCLKPGCNVDLSTETGVMGCYIFINNGPGKLPRRVPTGELMCIEHGKDGGSMMSREAFNAMKAEKSSESAKCDYEPGETTGRMHTDPNCRTCGEPKTAPVHR